MKLKLKITIITFLMVLFQGSMKAQNVSFKKSPAFMQIQQPYAGDIVWGYLNVPETWNSKNGKTIKIAVAILKKSTPAKNDNAVVFVQGGPGASGIDNIWTWLDHPLRKNNDIIVFDVRGTGYSQPRLSENLGQKMLEILAKNQPAEEDEKQKTNVIMTSKQDLISRGVNIDAYNSFNIAKDLHALKTILNYKNWNVYGVSYGTYIAQVYASNYPDDIKSLILDSAVYDISTYYVDNTSNYINSLQKVFEICKKDKKTNEEYPDLEKVYYKVIAELEKNPLKVSVDKSLIPSGSFTYNAEDFKVAVQQALYNKQLVEVIPMLIYQFYERKKEPLGNLVSAFSSLLSMDYGVYYCVSCNEALPNNDFSQYQQNASQFEGLNGGISFYKSDFEVCNAWNADRPAASKVHYDLSNLSSAKYKTLIFSGEFDPITPQNNGKKLAEKLKATNIDANTYGHVPSFTKIGYGVVEKFINNPTEKLDVNAFSEAKKIKLVTDIINNKGIANTGKSINNPDPIFLFPLVIALGIMLAFIFIYLIKLIKSNYTVLQDKIIRILVIITSITGLVFFVSLLMAILAVSQQNYYILAFGLPEDFRYVLLLASVFSVCLVLTLLCYILTIRKTNERSIIFSVIFSNFLLAVYLFYWGIL